VRREWLLLWLLLLARGVAAVRAWCRAVGPSDRPTTLCTSISSTSSSYSPTTTTNSIVVVAHLAPLALSLSVLEDRECVIEERANMRNTESTESEGVYVGFADLGYE